MLVTYRRAIAAAGVLALAAVLILLFGPPARAAGDRQLLVGRTASGPFAANLPTALFPDRYVPGDEVTRTFWVKNDSRDTARTTVAVHGDATQNDLSRALSFDIAIGDALPATGVTDPLPPGCLTIPGADLGPGEVQPVEVTMRVGDLRGQDGMGESAAVDLVVSLTQTVGGGDIDVCGEQGTKSHDQDHGGTTAAAEAGTREDCDRDVVVTTSGTPTCVPTSVPAGSRGTGGGAFRETQQTGGWTPAVVAGGAMLLVMAARRRRRREPAVVPETVEARRGPGVDGHQ